MSYDLDIVMRPMTPSDRNTIYGTWIASLSKTKIFASIPPEFSYMMLNDLIDKIFNISECYVACDKNDPDQIFGYIVYKDDTIFWIYTKYAFRKAYVGSRLLEHTVGKEKEKNIIWNTPAVKHLERKWNLRVCPQKLVELVGADPRLSL